jgi:hypothetical protein
VIVAADGARHRHPVTSPAVLIGWLGWLGWRGAPRALGCVATVLLAVVGCTTVTDGTPNANTAIAPAYRASVSVSVSASVATSSKRESQRQQSLTTQAVVRACESFVTSSKEAVDKVNDFVAAYNQGRDTTAVEGPAVDALNHSADTTEGDSNGPLSQQLREALNAYEDAARDVAKAMRAHAGMDEFNQRVNLFNDTKTEAVKRCRASL